MSKKSNRRQRRVARPTRAVSASDFAILAESNMPMLDSFEGFLNPTPQIDFGVPASDLYMDDPSDPFVSSDSAPESISQGSSIPTYTPPPTNASSVVSKPSNVVRSVICDARRLKREVLFAFNKTGKGSKSKKRFTSQSKEKC